MDLPHLTSLFEIYFKKQRTTQQYLCSLSVKMESAENIPPTTQPSLPSSCGVPLIDQIFELSNRNPTGQPCESRNLLEVLSSLRNLPDPHADVAATQPAIPPTQPRASCSSPLQDVSPSVQNVSKEPPCNSSPPASGKTPQLNIPASEPVAETTSPIQPSTEVPEPLSTSPPCPQQSAPHNDPETILTSSTASPPSQNFEPSEPTPIPASQTTASPAATMVQPQEPAPTADIPEAAAAEDFVVLEGEATGEDTATPDERPGVEVARSDAERSKANASKDKRINWGVPRGDGFAKRTAEKKIAFFLAVKRYHEEQHKWPNQSHMVAIAKKLGVVAIYSTLVDQIRIAANAAIERTKKLNMANTKLTDPKIVSGSLEYNDLIGSVNKARKEIQKYR